MVGGFAWDVGMSAIGQVDPLNEALIGEEFKKAKDGRSPNAEVSLLGIGKEICGGEVPLSAGDERGELAPRPGEANPRLIKRLEHLPCHSAILSELRLSLNNRRASPGQVGNGSLEGLGGGEGMITA